MGRGSASPGAGCERGGAMAGSHDGHRGERQPSADGPRRGGPRGEPEAGARRPGGLGLSRIRDSNDYELVHPRCVLQMRPDYEEGLELWKAGDPEAARDALRYALEGCGDNL